MTLTTGCSRTVKPGDKAGYDEGEQYLSLWVHIIEETPEGQAYLESVKLHREIGSTTIYVTHDQVEAMTMADRIVIMKDGIVQQIGKPMELYDHPVNKFVAGFIGSPQMNFFYVTIEGNEVIFSDGNKITLPDNVIRQLGEKTNGLIMGVRGEDIKLDAQNIDVYSETKQSAVVENAEVMGNENNLYFTFGGAPAVARVSKYEISRAAIRLISCLCLQSCISLTRKPKLVFSKEEKNERITP